jgi:hypothetical protein
MIPVTNAKRYLAELTALARERGGEEAEAINVYMRSPEFARCVAVVEPIVRADQTLCRPVHLPGIARELGVPEDIALMWLNANCGINITGVRR